jgi:LPXTG-motif cell wall-anchored protein
MRDSFIRNKRGVAFIAAIATLAAALIAPATANAATGDTYTDADKFVAGKIDDSIKPTLTVTKYLTTAAGQKATGSEQDVTAGTNPGQPGVGVEFTLTHIEPTGDASAMKPDDAASFTAAADGAVYTGKTDGLGQIKTWTAAGGSAVTGEFPGGANYYLLKETGPLAGYEAAKDTIFDLPYRATNTAADGTKTDGYVYNVHIFPKNVNTSQLNKQVVSSTGSAVAQPGDVLSYKVSEKIYNEGATADDSKVDRAELLAGNDEKPAIRLADRLSSALELTGDPTVALTYKDAAGNAQSVSVADYFTYTASTDAPKRLDPNQADDLFSDGITGAHTNYLVWDFFNSKAVEFGNLIPADATDIQIVVDLKATVTAQGDSVSGDEGAIVNTAAVDNTDIPAGTNPPDITTKTPTAGYEFAKVTTDGTALQGATFRLTDPTNDSAFLATDGNYYTDADSVPAGESFYEATSNNKGIVHFVGLPILTSADPQTGKADADLQWNVAEVVAPNGYQRNTAVFKTLAFSGIEGKSADEIASANPAGVVPSTKPDFKAYGTTVAFEDISSNAVTQGMQNWKDNEPGKPISLPLTGGMGIIIFLVAGVAVMGIVLAVRRRRNSARV